MNKIRVLVVDDSTVIRRLLSATLAEDFEIEVAATAANGRIALAKIPQVEPDIITLDMAMPEMNGIQTLVELRKLYAHLPVIFFSESTCRGSRDSFAALAKGANACVLKPVHIGNINATKQSVRDHLIPLIKEWGNRTVGSTKPPLAQKTLAIEKLSNGHLPTPRPRKIEVVAIGVSTGGPSALMQVMRRLPRGFPLPIVVVQHMPAVFTKRLADRLNQHCEIEILEGRPGEQLRAGTAYIAPGDWHMSVARKGNQLSLQTSQDSPENSCRPAVDVLFRSVAEVCGAQALAIVLTGMGQDGLRGSHAICDAGGIIYAQDETTSVVWGMPRAVAEAGIASKILPLEKVAESMIRVASLGRSKNPRLTNTA